MERAQQSLTAAVIPVAVRPLVWATALRQLVVLARPGWWRRWPPLPVPDARYLRFRMQTAYGDPERRPDPGDVVAWLQWCKQMGALRGRN